MCFLSKIYLLIRTCRSSGRRRCGSWLPERSTILIAPVESAALKLFDRDYYAGLAVTLRRGEEVDVEVLTGHLASVGYTQMDLVEMPGQFTRRGGILDVYSPEADRPVRIEFFGDEIETIRKFDPETQRSQSGLDEAQLLPLTETPVTERLLAAVHGRLSRQRVELGGDGEDEEMAADLAAAGGVSVFPGWEFFSAVAGANKSLLTLPPKCALFIEEPAMVRNQIDRWWNKVEQRHERSGIGSLIRPEDIYLRPEVLQAALNAHMGLDLDQLGVVDVLDEDTTLGEIELNTRPTLRFHGSIPALTEQLRALMAAETRIVLAAPHQGDVERLATVLREYQIPYRLGSRNPHPGETMLDEGSYLAGDLRVPVIVRTQIAAGVSFTDANLIVFGANDLSDEADVAARPEPKRSKTAAFVSDFRDLAIGDYVVHVEHGIAQYQGLKEIAQDGLSVEFMILEFAEAAKLYVPLTRLDLIQKYRSTDAGPAPALNRLGSQQWTKTKARVRKAMQDMAGELLKLYAERTTAQGTAFSKDNEFQREFEDSFDYSETDDQFIGDPGHQVRHGIGDADGSAAVRRRGLWQDGSCHAGGVQGRAGRQAGGGADADNGSELSAFRDLQEEVCAVPDQRGNDFAIPHAEGAEGDCGTGGDGPGGHTYRHAPAALKGHQVSGSGAAGGG